MVSCSLTLTAQTIPVGFPLLTNYLRDQQILQDTNSNSFCILPLSAFSSRTKFQPYFTDSISENHDLMQLNFREPKIRNFHLGLSPLQVQTIFNSDHPYGWNDGPMIPAKGLQTYFSGGLYASWGPLDFQFQPELVVAANPSFDGFSKLHYDIASARYYDYYNQIDLPERFGSGPFGDAYWGQSHLLINLKSISFGFSTENLWWGPGMMNSLLMSNTAPGIKHLTLHTNQPLKTAIGSFEGQIIAGWPQTSRFGVLTPERNYFGSPLYVPKPSSQRYFSGFVFTWQPKWIKGLFLGLERSMQLYGFEQSQFPKDYLPLFSPFQSLSADESLVKRQQLDAFFFRWIWKEEQAEIYGEWGRHQQNQSIRNAILEPSRNRAYVFGLRKLFPKSNHQYLKLNIEVCQLNETNTKDILNMNSWYINSHITAGYTNMGQEIGAGIGPGSNYQQVSLSWNKGLKQIGLSAERLLHNDDFYYYLFYDSGDFRRHWYDLSLRTFGSWEYQNLLFNASATATRSYNYGWYLIQKPGDPYFVNGLNKFNFQVQLGVNYRF